MLSTNYQRYLLIGAFLLTVLPMKAQIRIMTLDSVLHYIHHNNLMLQEHDLQTEAIKTYAEGAKSWMPPMVGAGVFMYPFPGQMIMEDRDKGMIMTAAQQEIPNPAKLKAKQKYMQSQAAIEEEGHEVMVNQFRAQAKTAYYQWVVLEKKKSVLQESQRIMEFMLKLSKVRYPYNQSSLGSIYKAEGRLHEVENMLLMNESEMGMKNIQLNILMNLPKDTRFQIDTVVKVPEIALLTDTSYFSTARSDVRQLDRRIESMRLNLQLENIQRRPDFSIRFENMMPRDRMMPQVFTAMGMMSVPIAPWSSRMFKANTKAMNLEIKAMQIGRENLLKEAQGMAANMGLELKAKKTQVQNYETKILPALRRNYQTTMLSYEQNTGQLPLVIDAWEALNMAQMEYLNNLEQLYLIGVNYEKELEK
jgi:cobalt-zinc-cadmium efflux system outer membrane protein